MLPTTVTVANSYFEGDAPGCRGAPILGIDMSVSGNTVFDRPFQVTLSPYIK
jgi:hypothetical protein